MIFFFGSSRSWAAREARRKARQMAIKKRRAMVKTTAGIFSFVILLLSLFSLTKTRRVEDKTMETKMFDQESGNMGNVSVKSADTTKMSTIEMPRPPLEPSLPTMSKDVISISNGGVQDGVQGVDNASIAKPEVNFSTMARVEAGQGTSQAAQAAHGDSIRDVRLVGEGSERSSYARSSDLASSGGTAVHGLTHEVSGGGGGSHDNVGRLSEHTTRDFQSSEAQNRQIHDVLGAEEGGEGLTINLPTRESSSGHVGGGGKNSFARVADGRERVRKEVEANLRQLYRDESGTGYTGITGERDSNSAERFGHGGGMNDWPEKGERNGGDMVQEASSWHLVGSGRYSSPSIKRRNGGVGKDTTGDEMISQRSDSEILRVGNVEKVREANKWGGSYDGGMDVRNGVTGNVANGVAVGMDETRDHVTNVYSKDSAVDTRYHVSSNAAGSDGVVTDALAVRNGVRMRT